MKQHIVKACSLLWLFTVCFTNSASVLPLNKQLYLAFDNNGPNYFKRPQYAPGLASPRIIGETSVIKIAPYSLGGNLGGVGSAIKTVGLVGDSQGPKCAIKTYMPNRPDIVNADICRLCQLGLVRQYNNKRIFRTGESSESDCGDSIDLGENDAGTDEVNIIGQSLAWPDMIDTDAAQSSAGGDSVNVENEESTNNIVEAKTGDGTYIVDGINGGNIYQEGNENTGSLISRQGGNSINRNYAQNNMGGNTGIYNGGSTGGVGNLGGRDMSGRGSNVGGSESGGRGINAGAGFSGGAYFGGGAGFGAGNVGGGKVYGGNIGGGASIGGGGTASVGGGGGFGGSRGNNFVGGGGGGGNMGAGAGIYGGANFQGSAGIQGGAGAFSGGRGTGGSGGIKGNAQIGGGAGFGMQGAGGYGGGANMYRSRDNDRLDIPDTFDNSDRFDSPDRLDNSDNYDRYENVDRLDTFDADRLDDAKHDIARLGSLLESLSDNIMLHGGMTGGVKHYGFGYNPKQNPFAKVFNRGNNMMNGFIGRSGIDVDELNSIEIATDRASISKEDDEDNEEVGSYRHGIDKSHEIKYEQEAHVEDFDGLYDVDSLPAITEQENSLNIAQNPVPLINNFGLG